MPYNAENNFTCSCMVASLCRNVGQAGLGTLVRYHHQLMKCYGKKDILIMFIQDCHFILCGLQYEFWRDSRLVDSGDQLIQVLSLWQLDYMSVQYFMFPFSHNSIILSLIGHNRMSVMDSKTEYFSQFLRHYFVFQTFCDLD